MAACVHCSGGCNAARGNQLGLQDSQVQRAAVAPASAAIISPSLALSATAKTNHDSSFLAERRHSHLAKLGLERNRHHRLGPLDRQAGVTHTFPNLASSAAAVTDLGRSIGRPSARDQMPCDSTPIARDTPNSTV